MGKNISRAAVCPLLAAAAALGAAAFTGCSSGPPVTFGAGREEELRLAEDISLAELEERLGGTGVDARRDLVVRGVSIDELSMPHTRVQQTVRGVPVLGGEAIVHLRPDGSLFAVTDALVRGIPADLDTTPTLSSDAAVDAVLARYDCIECLTAPPEADLWILRRDGDAARLVHRISLVRVDGSDRTELPVIFVDAHTGEEVWRYNNLQTAQGKSLYSGQVTIRTSTRWVAWYMEDIPRRIGTFDSRAQVSSTRRMTDPNNVWDASHQMAAVDAHYGAMKVYDYFLGVHGREGIDGQGGPGYYDSADGRTPLISSRVHYGTNYNNAFWDGSSMTYGDGDGAVFSPLVTLDICGHEMTHGITQHTAGLIYSGESGALNESMSDVFGAMVERYAQGEGSATWKLGEACYTPQNGADDALRYLDDTHKARDKGYTADDDPDHYSERYVGPYDNGGVHINSGISNKAFYLLAMGGAHHLGGSMTGIGADDAARIWFKALTEYMTASTNFAGARVATLSAAAAIFGEGSPQQDAVASAWTLVGVN